jgi:hypothetical protein
MGGADVGSVSSRPRRIFTHSPPIDNQSPL